MTTTTEDPIEDAPKNIIELGLDVAPAIARIDEFLTKDTNRTLIPQEEVRDFALDLRLLLTTDV